ncbi:MULTISPECIES: XdhC family protein [unclassified Tolypothrix]|uniref:XdhC family protein n=1 Tax=unclassified Tolypothrix TaxID=2649714 RepID=UPI0005EAAFB7|nr:MULTISPECIES: XdhC/CoxI family protein [unclassified Tolypothrix]BAY94493.1 putative xanthine dehydrogenase accessory factor [Microchaete diplosiphon NIES-3275]EKE97074.1 putative xanthine dehydrogenase [Tolypothrix sp. PCC 7601]MBE9086166.1 XdhC family protein [Tolypothrix sp. LEGE 11397]UYD28201.1 XdhC family protein [Tolypothrix sp. PCC 7712]UYD35921.1 XdhC family protein [Tolypothrix sp. PCC 7601]
MKEVIDEVEQWLNLGHTVALATVVKTLGSSPREVGAVMAVNDAGEVLGSVSGGCVEAAVVEEALIVIQSGEPRLLSYGVSDELGLSVGLTCGGTIQIFIQQFSDKLHSSNLSLREIFQAIRQSLQKPIAICTVVEGMQAGAKMIVNDKGDRLGSLGNAEIDCIVADDAQGMLHQGLTKLSDFALNEECRQAEVTVFIESFAPPPHLIIFGAIDFTRSLSVLAKVLGYRVTVCDARDSFATVARFPAADEVIVEWPHKYLESTHVDHRTMIVVLTHDPKFDVPALVSAVRTPAAYIGAMGSRRTTKDRISRLQEAGLTEAEINRISAPIGLDIGARTSEETAVSIMAEVIAQRSGRSGGRLSHNEKPIHAR